MKEEIATIVRLGVPAMLGQAGMMLLHAVDTMMLGHYGVSDLAAASLGTQWIFVTMTVAMGFVMGLDPQIAQAHGAQDRIGLIRAFHGGLGVAFLSALALSLAWSQTESVLLLFGQRPELARRAAAYVQPQIISTIPLLGWVALRSYLQGRGIMQPAMWVMLPVNLLNILFNWLFIYGNGGFAEYGLEGAAYATTLS
ncbi:MAG: hypothetical protein MK135_11750, partial [Polyangiaceae bacterium]|nr:hypothetical protein [Polyangiaceae bacterium]